MNTNEETRLRNHLLKKSCIQEHKPSPEQDRFKFVLKIHCKENRAGCVTLPGTRPAPPALHNAAVLQRNGLLQFRGTLESVHEAHWQRQHGNAWATVAVGRF